MEVKGKESKGKGNIGEREREKGGLWNLGIGWGKREGGRSKMEGIERGGQARKKKEKG